MYKKDNQLRFKASMLMSSLCDYNNAYIHVKGTTKVAFTNCISRINNTQIDDPPDIDVIMPMYNLIEYSDNY